jgi:hypothetical protein
MTTSARKPLAFALCVLVIVFSLPPQAVLCAADIVRSSVEGGAKIVAAVPATVGLPGGASSIRIPTGVDVNAAVGAVVLPSAEVGLVGAPAPATVLNEGSVVQPRAQIPASVSVAPQAPTEGAVSLSGPIPAENQDTVSESSGKLDSAGVSQKTALTATDPRRSGFAGRVWAVAEKLGFARKPSAVEVVPDAPAGSAQTGLVPDKAEPAAKPAGAGDVPAPKKALSMLSSTVLGFFSSFLLLQVIVESTALAGPQMADPYTQGFLRLAGVSSGIYLAYAAGSFVGGRIVERFGLRNVYRAVMASRVLIWAAMAHFYDPVKQIVPFVPLLTLFCVDYFVHSIGRVAEHTLHAIWSEDSPIVSNRFATFRDAVEYGTVLTTLLVGGAIGVYGFNFVFYGAPFVFGAAALVTMFIKGLPQKVEKATANMAAGFKTLFSNATLRKLFLGQLLINNFFYLLCYVTATAFAVFSVHGNRDLGAALSSALTSFYGLGAFIGAAFLGNSIINRIEKKTESIKDDEQRKTAQKELFSRRAATALKWAAIGLVGSVGFFLNHSQLALVKLSLPFLHWDLGVFPVYAISLALIPAAIAAQVALTLLDPIFKQHIPSGMKASVVAANRTLTNLSYAVNFLVWCLIFHFFGAAGFIALIVACVGTAAAYLWLGRDINKSLKP